MESQNASEDSQNIENVNGSGGFIVLQTRLHWLSVPTLEINKTFLILNKAKCFCYVRNLKVTKIVYTKVRV